MARLRLNGEAAAARPLAKWHLMSACCSVQGVSATSRLQVDTDALRAYRAQLDSAATAFRGVEGAMNGISRSAAHLQLSATAAEFGVDWASSVEAIKADFEEVGDAIAAVGATLESAESELARLARQGAAAAWEGITAQTTSALNVLSAPRRFIGNSARTSPVRERPLSRHPADSHHYGALIMDSKRVPRWSEPICGRSRFIA